MKAAEKRVLQAKDAEGEAEERAVKEFTGEKEAPWATGEGTGAKDPGIPAVEKAGPLFRLLFVSNSTAGRSLVAKSMMQQMVKRLGMEDAFEIHAAEAGRVTAVQMYTDLRPRLMDLRISYHRYPRRVSQKDYEAYHYLIVMDEGNLEDIRAVIPSDPESRIRKLLSFLEEGDREKGREDVDDPWFRQGDASVAFRDIKRGLKGLLLFLLPERAREIRDLETAPLQDSPSGACKERAGNSFLDRPEEKGGREMKITAAGPEGERKEEQKASGKKEIEEEAITPGTVSGRLKEALKAEGISIMELYRRSVPCFETAHADFSRSSLHNYVRGTVKPPARKVIILAKALGVRAEWLCDGRGPSGLEEICENKDKARRDRPRKEEKGEKIQKNGRPEKAGKTETRNLALALRQEDAEQETGDRGTDPSENLIRVITEACLNAWKRSLREDPSGKLEVEVRFKEGQVSFVVNGKETVA